MVVVVVAEERVRHLRGRDAELEQAVMRAEAVVEHEVVAADLDEVARAHPPHRRRRRAGAEEPEAHGQNLFGPDVELGQEPIVFLPLVRHELLELRGGHRTRLDADVDEARLHFGRVEDAGGSCECRTRDDVVRRVLGHEEAEPRREVEPLRARPSPAPARSAATTTGRVPAMPSATSLPALTCSIDGGMPEK